MLQATPTPQHLARLYYELGQLGARTVGQKRPWPYATPDRETLARLAADMSRYDPRLFEALVEWLGRQWHTCCPLRLRTGMRQMRTPQTWGVIGAFVRQLDASMECDYFFDYLLRGWEPVAVQLYYHHHYVAGSPRAWRAATESVAEFRSWGFLAEHGPTLRQTAKQAAGTYNPTARHNMLSRLLSQHASITLTTYLTAVHHSISRQQAYLDLKKFPGLRRQGHGRGSRWSLKQTTA